MGADLAQLAAAVTLRSRRSITAMAGSLDGNIVVKEVDIICEGARLRKSRDLPVNAGQ